MDDKILKEIRDIKTILNKQNKLSEDVGKYLKDLNKHFKDFRDEEKSRNKNLFTILLSLGNQVQETRKKLGYFYQDYLSFNQKEKKNA